MTDYLCPVPHLCGPTCSPQRTDDMDGASPHRCGKFDDAPGGGVAVCTRPLGHGGPCMDRVFNRRLRNPKKRGDNR